MHETIPYIAFQHSSICLVHIADIDHFHVTHDIVLRALIQHFLCFRDAADHGTGYAPAIADQAKADKLQQRRRHACAYLHPVGAQQALHHIA